MSTIPNLILSFCVQQGYLSPPRYTSSSSSSSLPYYPILNSTPNTSTTGEEFYLVLQNIRLGCLMDGITLSRIPLLQHNLSTTMLTVSTKRIPLIVTLQDTVYVINPYLFLQRYYALRSCIRVVTSFITSTAKAKAPLTATTRTTAVSTTSTAPFLSILPLLLFIYRYYGTVPIIPILCGTHFSTPVNLYSSLTTSTTSTNDRNELGWCLLQWMINLSRDLYPVYQSIVNPDHYQSTTTIEVSNRFNDRTESESEWSTVKGGGSKRNSKSSKLPSKAVSSSLSSNVTSSSTIIIPVLSLSIDQIISCPVVVSGFLLDFPYLYDTQFPYPPRQHNKLITNIPSVLSDKCIHSFAGDIGTNCLHNMNLRVYQTTILQRKNTDFHPKIPHELSMQRSRDIQNNRTSILNNNSVPNNNDKEINYPPLSFNFSVPETTTTTTIENIHPHGHDQLLCPRNPGRSSTGVNIFIIKQWRNILDQRIHVCNNQCIEDSTDINTPVRFMYTVKESIENRPAILL